MPNQEFLETYPLYRKFAMRVPITLDQLPKPRLKMGCDKCHTEQTFVMITEHWTGKSHSNFPIEGVLTQIEYVCANCQQFVRGFSLKYAEDRQSVMKVGQYPAWDVRGDPNVEQMLGDHKTLLRRGLICESQGYGIAAFAYYRRIVEETIDALLDDITELLSGSELDEYQAALEETKRTRVTADKIELVKELLPAILRPDGMNPLKLLHEILSEGLHAETDEECLETAQSVRQIMVFLTGQIAASAEKKRSFSDGMKALLDRKAKRTAGV